MCAAVVARCPFFGAFAAVLGLTRFFGWRYRDMKRRIAALERIPVKAKVRNRFYRLLDRPERRRVKANLDPRYLAGVGKQINQAIGE